VKTRGLKEKKRERKKGKTRNIPSTFADRGVTRSADAKGRQQQPSKKK